MKIRFSHFWPGFNPRNNLFLDVIRVIHPNVEVVITNSEFVDLEIISVFYNKNRLEQIYRRCLYQLGGEFSWDYLARASRGFSIHKKFKARKIIWYTGENIRHPVGKYSGTISFDISDKLDNNLFFPYWMLRINWNTGNTAYEIMPTVEELLSTRKFERKINQVCTFSNARESNRERVVKSVERVSKVDKFGSAYNNFVKSKKEVSQNYAFQICTENDLYPDYVTEKLQESWYVKSIPIWSGLDKSEWFNKNSYIDVTNLTSCEIESRIRSLKSDEIEFMQIQPLLNKIPNLDYLKNFLGNIVNG